MSHQKGYQAELFLQSTSLENVLNALLCLQQDSREKHSVGDHFY